MSASELFSALIPSDDEEDARPLSPPLPSRDYDRAPSSASSEDEEEAPAAKRARNAAEQRAARSEAIRQGLLAQHAQVRARLEALKEEDPGVVVPPPARPEATSKELQAQILKLQKRAAYKPPERADEKWSELEPSQLAGAPLTLSGRWGSAAALEGTPVPEGGWLVVDLFCSIGGVSSAARALGHKVVLAIDMDGDQLKVHALNHPEARHVEMELGEKTEDVVLSIIDEAVPASERHRLWLHGSPPCQTQSLMRQMGAATSAENKKLFRKVGRNATGQPVCEMERKQMRAGHDKNMRGEKDVGLSLVQWMVNLVAKLQPAQFSIEEVSDKLGEVMALFQAAKRAAPERFDCTVVQMADFGVPHFRQRAIASRPATIHALRSRASLRARAPTVREAIGDTLEPAIQFIFGTITRPLAEPGTPDCKVRPQPLGNKGLDAPTRFTDGLVNISSLDKPCNTVCCRQLPLADKDYQRVRYTTPEELRKLTTFPPYEWPTKSNNRRKAMGYGNAVPPLFAQALFRAASPE